MSRGGRDDWASRFRRANARQSRRVSEADRQAAREIDPTGYLESCGFRVKREGRHLSVRAGDGGEAYRITMQDDGRWIWCDLYGREGGDNIDLVQAIEQGTGYIDAVNRLSSTTTTTTVRRSDQGSLPRQPPRLPPESPVAREEGRKYLEGRGITSGTIAHAERCGLLGYADGGVFFVGRDCAGDVRNATRRAIDPAASTQKRDLRGSDKSYSAILPGDHASVWIVEGGTDAMALHDLYLRRGREPPTVVVSGGAQVRSFLERDHIQAMLRRADRVVLAGEIESSPDAQARADSGHQRQAERVAEITGREVIRWTPSIGKDLADMNARQVAEKISGRNI